MPTNQLVVCGGEVDEIVGLSEAECSVGSYTWSIPSGPTNSAIRTLSSVPFHAILRSHLSKVCFDNGSITSSCQAILICGDTEVLLSFGFNGRIDAAN